MGQSSKVLLELETGNSSISSSIESKLLICNKSDILQSKTKNTNPPDKKPSISSVPKSQFLDKVKNFLPVMSEANKSLQLAAMDNSKDFNIEALEDDDAAHIEMDLMLGVADLHTPEAVAAAESAIDGCQLELQTAPSDERCENEEDDSGSDSSDEDEDSDSSDEDEDSDSSNEDEDEDEDEGYENDTCSPKKAKRTEPEGAESSEEAVGNKQSGKRPKIVEL